MQGRTFPPSRHPTRMQTNIPIFKQPFSSVRRRYKDFVMLREVLVRENPNVRIPELPPRRPFSNKLQEYIVNERMDGLRRFLLQYSRSPPLSLLPTLMYTTVAQDRLPSADTERALVSIRGFLPPGFLGSAREHSLLSCQYSILSDINENLTVSRTTNKRALILSSSRKRAPVLGGVLGKANEAFGTALRISIGMKIETRCAQIEICMRLERWYHISLSSRLWRRLRRGVRPWSAVASVAARLSDAWSDFQRKLEGASVFIAFG